MSLLKTLDMLRALHAPEQTIGHFIAIAEKMIDHAECLYCHEPISRVDVADDQPWVHDDSARSRGCRAASFRPGKGWNDSLDKRWKAAPEDE